MTYGHIPAFPLVVIDDEGQRDVQDGLTKREYFAAAALQGLLAGPLKPGATTESVAVFAADCADRLVEALNAPRTP